MSYEAKNPVQVTRRSLDIVETLRDLEGARLTTIADEVGLPNSTVHGHLTTLMEGGYVVKDGETYRLGLRFLELDEFTRSLRKIHRVTEPELAELAADTGEVATLVVEEGGFGVVLDSARGEEAVPADIDPGTRFHLHTSALGKVILAHLPEDEVAAVVDQHGLGAYTEETITDRDALREELRETRERNVAYDTEERVSRSKSVAESIKNESGQIVGSVGVSGPVGRFRDDRLAEIEDRLHDVTNIVELKLVYS
jgi:DNA-binding IclR family transcriptional regulator